MTTGSIPATTALSKSSKDRTSNCLITPRSRSLAHRLSGIKSKWQCYRIGLLHPPAVKTQGEPEDFRVQAG
jgi:hypothetical protein